MKYIYIYIYIYMQTCIFRNFPVAGRKGKKKVQRKKLEWLLPNSSTGSRPRFGVSTSRAQGARDKGQTRRGRDTFWRRDVTEMGLSRLDVVTSS